MLLVIPVLILISLMAYRWWYHSQSTTYHYKDIRRNVLLLQGLVPYERVPLWCLSGWVQSVYASKIRKGPDHECTLLKLEYNNGPFLLHKVSHQLPADTPVLFVVPGVAGHFTNDYIKNFVQRFKNDFQVVVWNWPGCGESPPTHHFPTFGDFQCIRTALLEIRKQHPNTQLFGIGMSMGGMLMLRYLTEYGNDALFDSVVVMSAGMHAGEGAKSFNNAVLNKAVSSKLLEPVKRNLDSLKLVPHLDVQKILSSSTVHEFDFHYTEKLLGKKIDVHYEDSSPTLHKIQIPTLILNSHDDPIVPSHLFSILKQATDENPNLISVQTKFGGHLGWIQYSTTFTWSEDLTFKFFMNCRLNPDFNTNPVYLRSTWESSEEVNAARLFTPEMMSTITCTECFSDLPKKMFSKSQFDKSSRTGKCLKCVPE